MVQSGYISEISKTVQKMVGYRHNVARIAKRQTKRVEVEFAFLDAGANPSDSIV